MIKDQFGDTYYKLALHLHTADMRAAYLDEK